ncbi:hypothetical protein BC941DRAFT_32170 [Chlamydoabsidia padenii]|nr:hypothetical protein BC941DRAFT_32170 [Chlamydoabsidia padenii]
MADSALVLWKDLQQYWIQNYTSSTHITISQFLEPPRLFAPDALGIGLPFIQGIHQQTREHQLLLRLNVAERLGEIIGRQLETTKVLQVPLRLQLPSDDYDLYSSEINIKDRNHYQKLTRQVTQANKRERKLMDAQQDWRQAQQLLRSHSHVFVSLDIEAYEADHSILLEIGWTLYDGRENHYQDQHYMMEPYRHLRNGKYVDDQRMNFDYGTSVWCTLGQALNELHKDLAWATRRDGGFVLVGHGLNSDLIYLKQCKFEWPVLDGTRSKDGLFGLADQGVVDVHASALRTIVNTDTLYGAWINDLHNPPSLGRCLTLMDIEHWHLHNAGNDAHYTMELMMKLLEKP